MPGLPIDVARQRFAAAPRAVLGTAGPIAGPHLVPVTFALVDDDIVFAVDHKPKSTPALRRLDNIAAQPRVCFLVDHYDDDWRQLWWVRIDAEATLGAAIDDPRAVDALVAKYPAYEQIRPNGVLVRSRIEAVVGWTSTAMFTPGDAT